MRYFSRLRSSLFPQKILEQIKKTKPAWACLCLLPILLTACCISPPSQPQESSSILDTSLPTPEHTPAEKTPTQPSLILPASFYYLHDEQIWHISRDGLIVQQITQEEVPVEAFDYSPVSQALVYVSGNRLILTDAEGGGRQVLQDGGQLPHHHDLLNSLNDPEHIRNAIRTPYWSPDGNEIAFIANGLQVYDLETGQVATLWENILESREPVVLDRLFSWSPDGRYFLLSEHTYPVESQYQRTLVLIDTTVGTLTWLAYPALATYAWSPDVSTLILAKAEFGTAVSLLHCSLPDLECTLIGEFEPSILYYNYAHPWSGGENDLRVFMGTTRDPDQPAKNLFLIRKEQLYGWEDLRRDEMHLPWLVSALWAPFGDGILVVIGENTADLPLGSVLWLDVIGSPPILLPVAGASNLRWGDLP